MTIYNYLADKFGNNLSENVKLSNYSWFNLGGNADYFFKAKIKKEIIEFLKDTKKNKIKINIIGAGSNILFRDNGIKGAVIKLGGEFSYIKKLDKDTLDVGAATLDRAVANFAKNNNIGNFEFLSCIPGSIGGAVIMNSGCYNDDISKILLSIKVIDINNFNEIEIPKKEIDFFYRGTSLQESLIITSVKLKGLTLEKKEIEKKQSNLIAKKKLSQPSQVKTCGSTFKNISKDKKAWMFIKEAGCQNLQVGDAIISEKHCNFFVNNGNAKSLDIETLIKK